MFKEETKRDKLLTFLTECEATDNEYNPFICGKERLFRVLSVPQDNGSHNVEINGITFHNAILIEVRDDKHYGDRIFIYSKDDVSLDTSKPWNAYNKIGEVKIDDICTLLVQRRGMRFKN